MRVCMTEVRTYVYTGMRRARYFMYTNVSCKKKNIYQKYDVYACKLVISQPG